MVEGTNLGAELIEELIDKEGLKRSDLNTMMGFKSRAGLQELLRGKMKYESVVRALDAMGYDLVAVKREGK